MASGRYRRRRKKREKERKKKNIFLLSKLYLEALGRKGTVPESR